MDLLLLLLAYFGIVVVVFLICRELVCWYWKINRGMALLEEGVQLLRQIRDAANRSEQSGIDQQIDAAKRAALEGGRVPPLR